MEEAITRILKSHIGTVNSFVDDSGHNHFMDVIREIAELFKDNDKEFAKTILTEFEKIVKKSISMSEYSKVEREARLRGLEMDMEVLRQVLDFNVYRILPRESVE